MKHPVEIDDFVNPLTDMTHLIIPFVVGVVWCGFALDDNDVGRWVFHTRWVHHVIKLCRIE